MKRTINNAIQNIREKINSIHDILAKVHILEKRKDTQKAEHIALLQMLFMLFQLFRKDGPQAIEPHIESPERSDIFKMYPEVMRDYRLVEAICDAFKICLSADMSPENLRDYILEQENETDPLSTSLKVAHAALIMQQNGAPPLVCIEAARKTIPYSVRPSFAEMDTATKYSKSSSRFSSSSSKEILDVFQSKNYFSHAEIELFSPLFKEISDLKVEIAKLKVKENIEQDGLIQAMMADNQSFTINDFDLIDDRGIQTILKEVPNDKLLLAMKTLPLSIKLKFFKNISERASQLLQEDLKAMGPARLSDVEGSQQEIVNTTLRLVAEGKILIARRRDPDTLV